MQEIKDLAGLLSPMLGDTKQIISYETKNLMAPGENYGSVMLSVDLKIKEQSEEDCEDLHLVAKMCPPTEFIKKIFNVPVTFKKESGFYSTVIPTLQAFQRENGCKRIMDFFPTYYGSRISLTNSTAGDVDDNACLLLENIKVKGYEIGNRLKGFNLETSEYLIKDLATFHAVPIALKLKRPDVFKAKVLPYLVKHVNDDSIPEELRDTLKEIITNSAIKNAACALYLDRINTALAKCEVNWIEQDFGVREPFASIVHNDFWVNNTMVKFDDEGHPIANAMVDFQMIIYGNPMQDLIFFIYTSTANEVRKNYFQRLIDVYYKTFIGVLKELDVDLAPFNYDAFLDEINFTTENVEFYHILFMLKPIFTDKDKVKELKDINENELLDTKTLADEYYPKLWGTIIDFVERKWI